MRSLLENHIVSQGIQAIEKIGDEAANVSVSSRVEPGHGRGRLDGSLETSGAGCRGLLLGVGQGW